MNSSAFFNALFWFSIGWLLIALFWGDYLKQRLGAWRAFVFGFASVLVVAVIVSVGINFYQKRVNAESKNAPLNGTSNSQSQQGGLPPPNATPIPSGQNQTAGKTTVIQKVPKAKKQAPVSSKPLVNSIIKGGGRPMTDITITNSEATAPPNGESAIIEDPGEMKGVHIDKSKANPSPTQPPEDNHSPPKLQGQNVNMFSRYADNTLTMNAVVCSEYESDAFAEMEHTHHQRFDNIKVNDPYACGWMAFLDSLIRRRRRISGYMAIYELRQEKKWTNVSPETRKQYREELAELTSLLILSSMNEKQFVKCLEGLYFNVPSFFRLKPRE